MSTRATVDAVREQMAAERAAIDQARATARDAAQRAEEELLELLHAPLHSWDEDAFWQLATCEYALDHLDDVDSSPKQLQLSFRAACEMVRNPLHVPRLRGSTRIDALHDALHAFERLRGELVHKLGVFKRFGRLLLADDGLRALSVRRSRARRVVAGAHETHARGHTEMAAAGAAAHREARSDLEGECGRYTAEWRKDTYLQATRAMRAMRATMTANRSTASRQRAMARSRPRRRCVGVWSST